MNPLHTGNKTCKWGIRFALSPKILTRGHQRSHKKGLMSCQNFFKNTEKLLPHCNNRQDHNQKACVLLLGTCVAPRRLLYTSTCRPQVHWKIWAARSNVTVPRGCTPFPAKTKHDVMTGLHMMARKMMLLINTCMHLNIIKPVVRIFSQKNSNY